MLALLFVVAACCIGLAQEQPADEEYRVYEAVLKLMDTIPKQDPHVAIYHRTLTSRCGLADEIAVFAKGCSFFWVKPDTDEDVERNLRSRFHGLHRSTWKSFKASNATSINLHDPISAPWKHKFTGPYAPSSEPTTDALEAPPADFFDEWASPDMTIYFSRVGFDKKKTEALVYVLVFSYVGRAATTGDYLRFRREANQDWTLAGRVSYLKQDSSLTASLHRNPLAVHEHVFGAPLLPAVGRSGFASPGRAAELK
jgi:hypothetical protein